MTNIFQVLLRKQGRRYTPVPLFSRQTLGVLFGVVLGYTTVGLESERRRT